MTRFSKHTILTLLTVFGLAIASESYAQPGIAVPAVPTPADAPVVDREVADADAMQVLEQGPLHEAFAQPLALEAEAIIVDSQPPEPVNELPPDERPEGNNIHWLPGYWSFDREREDFVWVSGLWRDFPPKRTWIPGQWQAVAEGFQWIPGYWADAALEEQAFLPPPPASLEQGPSSPAPGDGYLWAPGCWQWQNADYVWQPGYWYAAQPDWVWVPNHYSYTPRGAVYVSGYWDYPLARRGLLYAPVYWGAGYRFGVNYFYRPRTVLNTGLLAAHLFLDHGYGRYYFGARWGVGGRYPSWVTPWGSRAYSQWGRYHAHSNLYDPLWAHFRWNGHRKGAYGKSGNRHLTAKNFHNLHAKDPSKLMRNVDRLSQAQRDGIQLRRASDAERAKFAKEADRYRNFNRDLAARGPANRDAAGRHFANNGQANRNRAQGEGQRRQIAGADEVRSNRNRNAQLNVGEETRRRTGEGPRFNINDAQTRNTAQNGRRRVGELGSENRLSPTDEIRRREIINRMRGQQGNATAGATNAPANTGRTLRTEVAKPYSPDRWNSNRYNPRLRQGQQSTDAVSQQQSILRQRTQSATQNRDRMRNMVQQPNQGLRVNPRQGNPNQDSALRMQSTRQFRNNMPSANRGNLQNTSPQRTQSMRRNAGQNATRRVQSTPQVHGNAGGNFRPAQRGQFRGRGGAGGNRRRGN